MPIREDPFADFETMPPSESAAGVRDRGPRRSAPETLSPTEYLEPVGRFSRASAAD